MSSASGTTDHQHRAVMLVAVTRRNGIVRLDARATLVCSRGRLADAIVRDSRRDYLAFPLCRRCGGALKAWGSLNPTQLTSST